MDDIETRLRDANARLKAALIGVAIQQIGDRLYLRATLPPKPHSLKTSLHQQRISLGIYANVQGIKRAESEAVKVGGLLACKEFQWHSYYLPPQVETPSNIVTVGELVENFEQDYFSKRHRNYKTETTWLTEYKEVFKRLPQSAPLTQLIIREAILSTKPDSRSRVRFCLALGALAKFASVDFDTKPFRGSYNAQKVSPRHLPTDLEIASWFYKITSPEWQWFYGMVATFGLRNHEVFHVDLVDFTKNPHVASVLEGKTGARQVWAYYPEWVDDFDLINIKVPKINLNRPNKSLGWSASYFFRTQNCPFKLLTLRHCWAVRTLEFGLDVTLASQQMGHSVAVHTTVYHHWISAKHHQSAFQNLTQSPNRPLPPAVT